VVPTCDCLAPTPNTKIENPTTAPPNLDLLRTPRFETAATSASSRQPVDRPIVQVIKADDERTSR